ncbi:MAG: hypothetical protein OER88_10715, partial [Planctomycetota bacterium]|nr:hypothetical protein [Planctomycetota bacterium]
AAYLGAMLRLLIPLALVAACSKDGVSARVREALPAPALAALQNAESVDLVSLYPNPRGYDEKEWAARGLDKAQKIDDYAVLGKTTLGDADRDTVLGAFYQGIDDSDGTVAACFNPRHALTANHAGKRYDIVICYQCLSMTVYENGERIGQALTTEAPKRTLNATLRAAKVRLPDR